MILSLTFVENDNITLYKSNINPFILYLYPGYPFKLAVKFGPITFAGGIAVTIGLYASIARLSVGLSDCYFSIVKASLRVLY